MPMKPKLLLIVSLLALTVSCRAILPSESTPTPLPGWRSLVSELLLGDEAFPSGWARIRDHPQGSLTDSTIDHVYRSWWGKAQSSGKADQAVWRAYTTGDAENWYAELRQRQFHPSRTLPPYELFLEFEPPDEIDFHSQVADEFYLACGWWTWAYCEVVARYRNYVVDMHLDLEAEYAGHTSEGLTYAEIETAVRAMDAKFAEAMAQFYPSRP